MFIPETIDLGQSEKYDLSIRIRPDGFKFLITDPDVPSNYCLRETTFSEESMLNNVKRIIFDLNFLTQHFRKTNVLIVSKDYEIVPEDYFLESEKSSLYNFTNYNVSKYLLTHNNSNQHSITLFDIDNELYEFLMRSIYNPIFIHHTNPLINKFQNHNKTENLTSRMFVNFHDDMMDIISFSKEKLLLCQTHQGQHPMNQLYFILKSWEYCKFDQQKDYLYIIGNPFFEIIEGIKKYILNIETLNFCAETFFSNEDMHHMPLDLLLSL